MNYIYGPVNSRRLGFSLGVSAIPHKACSFNCVYCQLGATAKTTSERKEYIPVADILAELKSWLQDNPGEAHKLSYITLAGSGEPLLNARITDLIASIKEAANIPLAVITNASLLQDPAVRRELLRADLIVPTLNTATDRVLQKISRPAAGFSIEGIINGLAGLRKEFSGKIWLEIMLVKGFNDDLRQIKKLKQAVDKINPDKVQLNSPVRTTAEPGIAAVEPAKLKKIQKIFGEKCEII